MPGKQIPNESRLQNDPKVGGMRNVTVP